MLDALSIGDTSHNVFLEMDPQNAHLYCDHKPEVCQICFNYADKIPVKNLHDTIGGNSANAAVSLARLGLRTAIYTHVGSDDQGPRILAEFRKNNVATDYVRVDEGMESNYSSVINLNAERTILVYHLHRHYNLPEMEGANWIYYSSMGEGFESIFPQIIEYTQQHGSKLCYQPGTFQLNYGAERSKTILQHSHAFYVNREEAELYLGRPHGTPFRELLDGLLALGPKIVVITDGPKGAYVSDGNQYLYLGIIKEAPRNEATGAGDAFTSAFTAALSSGEELAEALRWGQCQSSSVIQKVGPQAGLLYPKEMVDLLVGHPELFAVPLDSVASEAMVA
jgi:ribokinase